MGTTAILAEFRSRWLPHVTDGGLTRLINLLESGSPLLIHGSFTQACAMGCLATHIGWHHPKTASRNDDAGVLWLTKVAGLNPATSQVIVEWDRRGPADWDLRSALLSACREEKQIRSADDHDWDSTDCREYVTC